MRDEDILLSELAVMDELWARYERARSSYGFGERLEEIEDRIYSRELRLRSLVRPAVWRRYSILGRPEFEREVKERYQAEMDAELDSEEEDEEEEEEDSDEDIPGHGAIRLNGRLVNYVIEEISEESPSRDEAMGGNGTTGPPSEERSLNAGQEQLWQEIVSRVLEMERLAVDIRNYNPLLLTQADYRDILDPSHAATRIDPQESPQNNDDTSGTSHRNSSQQSSTVSTDASLQNRIPLRISEGAVVRYTITPIDRNDLRNSRPIIAIPRIGRDIPTNTARSPSRRAEMVQGRLGPQALIQFREQLGWRMIEGVMYPHIRRVLYAATRRIGSPIARWSLEQMFEVREEMEEVFSNHGDEPEGQARVQAGPPISPLYSIRQATALRAALGPERTEIYRVWSTQDMFRLMVIPEMLELLSEMMQRFQATPQDMTLEQLLELWIVTERLVARLQREDSGEENREEGNGEGSGEAVAGESNLPRANPIAAHHTTPPSLSHLTPAQQTANFMILLHGGLPDIFFHTLISSLLHVIDIPCVQEAVSQAMTNTQRLLPDMSLVQIYELHLTVRELLVREFTHQWEGRNGEAALAIEEERQATTESVVPSSSFSSSSSSSSPSSHFQNSSSPSQSGPSPATEGDETEDSHEMLIRRLAATRHQAHDRPRTVESLREHIVSRIREASSRAPPWPSVEAAIDRFQYSIQDLSFEELQAMNGAMDQGIDEAVEEMRIRSENERRENERREQAGSGWCRRGSADRRGSI